MTPSYAIASRNRSCSVLNRFVYRQMGLLLGEGVGAYTWRICKGGFKVTGNLPGQILVDPQGSLS